MPRQHPKWHTAYAMAAYIAQNTELPLCAASLAAVIRDRMPEATPVSGEATQNRMIAQRVLPF